MIKIELTKDENFLKVAETLTRMGIANKRDKVIYQSCHILQKQGSYYIAHFKDMMKLDGKPVVLSDEDISRRYSIAKTLESWGLVTVVDNPGIEITNNFLVLKHALKSEWKLVSKYKMGT